MKILYKIIFISFVLLFFILIGNVHANSINSITMDIYVDNDGDAHVTEVWDCKTTQGTECYHPYYNLGGSMITAPTVYEGNRTYTTLERWNTSGSLDSKAYKCGLNKISNGVEICWGISSYGKHTYTVKYTITGFVAELSDSQMIYWTLIPYEFSNTIGRAYIKIHSDFDYDIETPVWGYGNKGGTCYVYDGYIEMESDGSLDKSEYMTILVKYPPETFTMENKLVKNKLPYTFDYYYNMAEDGADHYIQKNKSNSVSALTGIIVSAVPFLLVFFALFALIAKAGNSQLNFGKTGNKVPKDAPMFRDIPCKGDIFRGYFIAKNYNLMKKKTDFLGAVLLKWLKEGKIKIEKREVGKVFNKEDTCIIFDNTTTFDNVYEKDLHNMFFKASKDGILEKKEFEKWCSNNYSEILGWFDDLLKFEQSGLLNEGKIIKEENKKLGFKNYRYTVDSSLMEEAKELYGLKKFLDDFTLIDKREAIEVALFEDYLIFAQILGISKKVASQFKKLYPEVIEQYNYDYNDILLIHSISDAGVSKANSAKSRAESYSSGRRRILIWRWPEVAHLVAGGGGGGFR